MAENISPPVETPRDFANKSSKPALLAAIRMALRVESSSVRYNVQSLNRNRYIATADIPDYEALKDQARAIKERSLRDQPELVATLESAVRRNGGHFFLAQDAHVASHYIGEVCKSHGVRLVVKAKSMTSEEIGLNHVLEALGIEVAETDLAEFILQIADEQPSHIVGPALHYSRERITALFKRVFKTDLPLDSGEALTAFARDRLRQKFLSADAGISGANFVAADSGTLVLVESEANIRMTTLVPPLHIAVTGIEKIVPAREDLAPFIELLAASGTGQPMTSYTSVIRPPLAAPVISDGPAAPREFHLVIVDNGRGRMRADPVLCEALYCIRCGACANCCANFQAVGGHAFGGQTYSGGIGGAWEAGTRDLASSRFAELCTGCSRCVTQCPVRIDIPWLNTVLRHRLGKQESSAAAQAVRRVLTGVPADDAGASMQKLFFGRYDVAGKWGARFASLANAISRLALTRAILERFVGLDRRRALPPFAATTLVAAAKRRKRRAPAQAASAATRVPRHKAVLFADIFTNYGSPERGLATLDVLEALGVDIIVSAASPDGRAALSQGMIATATRQARRTAARLAQYLAEGRDIVVVEPSVLAMFRLDYRHLLPDDESGRQLYEALRVRTFDAAEYVWKCIQEDGLDAAKIFPAAHHPGGARIFYHSHCQQKTSEAMRYAQSGGSAQPAEALLRAAGFDVATSQVECCGMAGSFGYKKDYYDLSCAVGEDLFAQIRQAEAGGAPRTLVVSGTSCHEQIHAELGRPVVHVMELLSSTLAPPISSQR
ncbi:MAG: LUD domain-containing protein [Candidatus Acidiferrales bacterium]|jgi:iron-sulfur cluster protein